METGAALDCNGNIIELKEPQSIDFIKLIKQQNIPLSDKGDGSICMSIALDTEGKPTYHLEPYNQADFSWQSLLDGTLLMDFFDDCISDLIKLVREEINLNTDDAAAEETNTNELVSFQQRRMTALLNLIIQLINTENGRYVFLSQKEHDLLEDLYLRLREKLQSKTFCAMFEGNDFPEYPFPKTKMTTLFGKGSHTHLIVHSLSNRAYSFAGTDNTINVYDLSTEELINVVKMPAGEGAEVQFVAVSPKGDQIYAVATIRGVDTVFGVADISGNEYQWRKTTVLCGLVITKLIASEKDPGLLYAIGKGTGLYFLRPELLLAETKPEPKPTYTFNAVGHLVVDEENQRAFATANNASFSNDIYNQIVYLNLEKTSSDKPTSVLHLTIYDIAGAGNSLTGNDDIALGETDITSSRQQLKLLYVVTNHSNNNALKHLIIYGVDNVIKNLGDSLPIATLDLENTTIRLAFHQRTRQLLISMEDGYRMQSISVISVNAETKRNDHIPVQISPIAITSDSRTDQVYILNFISNTISRVPGRELGVNEGFPSDTKY